MLKIFYNKIINRLVCLLLVAVFLSTFTTGATALALCLDEDENHLIGQNLYLAACHSSVEVDMIFSDEHCSALAEKENKDCTDVSLTNANILHQPSKIILPISAKVFLSYAIPHSQLKLQQQVARNDTSALSQHLFTLPRINAHRTVVLLI